MTEQASPTGPGERLARLFDAVTAHPSTVAGQVWEDFAKVEAQEADRIRTETGMDVAGYVHTLTDSDLLHILKRHGEGHEEWPGQEPIGRDDLLRLPEIVRDFDRAWRTDRPGAPVALWVSKRINGTVFVLQEVRTGRKKLAIKTLWKRKA